MLIPETRYARTADGVSIAYAVIGEGPRDLVAVPGWVSHLEVAWEEPTLARFYERLATFSRLILFDKRGTGLSDRVPENQLPDARDAHGRPAHGLRRCRLVERGRASGRLGGSADEPPVRGDLPGANDRRHPVRRVRAAAAGARLSVRRSRPRRSRRSWRRSRGTGAVRSGWTPERRAARGDPRFRETWARYLRLGSSPAAVRRSYR